MKNLYNVKKEYGEELVDFISPLASDWETVVFKAIDILHGLDMKGLANTKAVKAPLLSMTSKGAYNQESLFEAINATDDIDTENQTVRDGISMVRELLFAVKISIKS